MDGYKMDPQWSIITYCENFLSKLFGEKLTSIAQLSFFVFCFFVVKESEAKGEEDDEIK
jgi:hypothetical protein